MCHESDDDAAVDDDDEAAAVATLLITLLLFFLIRSFLFCFLNLWGLLLVYCAEMASRQQQGALCHTCHNG